MAAEQVSFALVMAESSMLTSLPSPLIQNLIVSTVLFCNPGLYLTIAVGFFIVKLRISSVS
jgi:hypothetical protein